MRGGNKLLYANNQDRMLIEKGDQPSYTSSHPEAKKFDMPWFFVDFNSNTKSENTKSRLIEGISNHTSDYQLIIKRLSDVPAKEGGDRTLWVWLEYAHGAELSGGSDFTSKSSQIITKVD